MLDMAKHSIQLFVQGKLFQNNGEVMQKVAIGAGGTAVLTLVLALIGLPVWLAAIVAGALGGAVQPYLFKDLKYR
ncbi:MAG: hypothetical protein R3F54_19440 [Alphaproteobacteria bacterium]